MEYFILSRTGGRERNEDSAGAVKGEHGFCCVVADGLGGHDRGEEASALAKDTCLELFSGKAQKGDFDLQEFLEQCFLEGQRRLLSRQKEEKSGMKTTLTVLAAWDGKLQWGHVGDSRLYWFRNGKTAGRTLDHSVPQMLVASGEIREKDIRGHEDRSRLLRVMGAEWSRPQFELSLPVPTEDGLAFLLCSDGFWELIEEKEMEKALRRAETTQEWLEAMEREIVKNGYGPDMDNYTAVGVWLGRPLKRQRLWGLF